MAKKKARSKVKKKPSLKLESRFDCPICSHENVVQCKIALKTQKGTALCTVCEANYTCLVSSIEKPIDIYHNWIDDLGSRKSTDSD